MTGLIRVKPTIVLGGYPVLLLPDLAVGLLGLLCWLLVSTHLL